MDKITAGLRWNKLATNLPAPRSAMKIIECEGSPQSLGEQTGEALREEIREHISLRPMRDWPQWERRAPLFLDTLKTGLPRVLDEMLATARAADVPEREILRLNLPLYPHRLTALSAASPSTAPTDAPAAAASAPGEGCTNFVFSDGPDGPVWGKNNDERRSKSSPRAAWRSGATRNGRRLTSWTQRNGEKAKAVCRGRPSSFFSSSGSDPG